MTKVPAVAPEHSRQLLRLLTKGDREISAGKGYDLDTVLADVDRALRPVRTERSQKARRQP